MAAFEQRLDSFFHITERGSTVRTEPQGGDGLPVVWIAAGIVAVLAIAAAAFLAARSKKA